jgi:RNA polymerase sigma factor (sigma-70 family)
VNDTSRGDSATTSMDERTDASLVALARCGDKQAFCELIERYQAMAQILTVRLVGNVDIAREMAQEAMLQAYLSLDHLRDDTRFKNWFYGIVLNVCRNNLREQKRSILSLEATLTGLNVSENHLLYALPDPHEVLEEHELQQLVQEAMNLLSSKNRTVTYLFYYKQLSLQEIAIELGISVVAVKSRLHQARKELRGWLISAYPEIQPAIPLERKRKKMIKVTIAEVLQQDQYSIVILHDKAGKRALPVWVGYWESEAIASNLGSRSMPRPLTFNFMAQLLNASGSKLEEIRIESLKDDTFYAVARIRHGNTIQEVEARPSDALALAVYTKSVVYVSDEVMERSAIALPTVNGKLTQQDLDTIVGKLKEKKPVPGLTSFGSGLPNRPRNLDFADETTGWGMAGSRPQNYESGVDRNIKRSGEGSAYLKSKLSESGAVFGTLMQTFNAEDYRNKRVRLSGYIKSEAVEPWAGFWMRVDDANGKVLSFDNMQSRPIWGTTDWQRYDVVLDVPENGFNIAFGILLGGKGQVWFDELQFETVEQNVPTTDLEVSTTPCNLDFKQGTTGWFLNGSHPQNYEEGLDQRVKRSGSASAYLKSTFSGPGGSGTLMQMCGADTFCGKRVRLSGYVKSEGVEPWAGLWMRVDDPVGKILGFDNMQDRPIMGTSDWQKYEVVLDVPENSVQIAFGILLAAKGQVWLDDLRVEIVGQNVPTTDKGSSQIQPQNLNFAEGITGWYLAGSHPHNYDYGIDSSMKWSSESSAYLKNKAAEPAGFGALMQTRRADIYAGKRLKMAGYVKARAVERYAGLWLSYENQGMAATFNSIPSTLITGSRDWQKYEIVADIPESSNSIGFGIVLSGKGQVWLSNLQFEIVDSNVPTTV